MAARHKEPNEMTRSELNTYAKARSFPKPESHRTREELLQALQEWEGSDESLNDVRRRIKKAALLAHFSENGNITAAARHVGVKRTTHYIWLEKDKEYAAEFKKAQRAARDALESEAIRRAVYGVDEPVHYKGERIDTIKKYSDTLLIVLLKGHYPEKYAERHKVQVLDMKEFEKRIRDWAVEQGFDPDEAWEEARTQLEQE